ncbi:MAG: hypothetical protein HYV07_14400 [Deltaproteobacteria bacterium]|nr:hypothetical protein [Deltaproteobacteria bacterium]
MLRTTMFVGLGCMLLLGPGCGGDDARINQPPTAVAGEDRTAFVGASVVLDGSKSSDPDGDPLNYVWTLTVPEGSHVRLSDPNTARARFAPDVKGQFRATLTVDDGRKSSVPAAVRIDVLNRPPVARAGDDVSGTVGVAVALDGSGSTDPDGDPLTHHWSLTSAPAGSLSTIANDRGEATQLTPDRAGNFEIMLEVFDGTETATDAISLSITPV